MNDNKNILLDEIQRLQRIGAPAAFIANAIAADYLRKMNIVERRVYLPDVKANYPDIYEYLENVYSKYLC